MSDRVIALLVATALIGLSVGCGGRESGTARATLGQTEVQIPAHTAPADIAERVSKAARIANAIEEDPDRAEEILSDNGMTLDEFEDLMYAIAQDPALTSAYEAARKKE